MNEDTRLANKVGVRLLDFEIINPELALVAFDRLDVNDLTLFGQQFGADRQLACRHPTLAFDPETVLRRRLDDLAFHLQVE